MATEFIIIQRPVDFIFTQLKGYLQGILSSEETTLEHLTPRYGVMVAIDPNP